MSVTLVSLVCVAEASDVIDPTMIFTICKSRICQAIVLHASSNI